MAFGSVSDRTLRSLCMHFSTFSIVEVPHVQIMKVTDSRFAFALHVPVKKSGKIEVPYPYYCDMNKLTLLYYGDFLLVGRRG